MAGHPACHAPFRYCGVVHQQPGSAETIHVALLREGAKLPYRATDGATGFDIYACLESDSAEIAVGVDPVLIPTGIALEIPGTLDVQIRPRSGLSSRGVMGTVGTIDSDYRGEIFVTLYIVGNRGPHIVRNGDRIAQLVVGPRAPVSFDVVESLDDTRRGEGGHGSTGP